MSRDNVRDEMTKLIDILVSYIHAQRATERGNCMTFRTYEIIEKSGLKPTAARLALLRSVLDMLVAHGLLGRFFRRRTCKSRKRPIPIYVMCRHCDGNDMFICYESPLMSMSKEEMKETIMTVLDLSRCSEPESSHQIFSSQLSRSAT